MKPPNFKAFRRSLLSIVSTAPLFRECSIAPVLNNATFHICPLFSQHVLGQTIHWQLPKPTVGTVNGRIGGTKMSSRRRKNLLRRGCDTAPFSRRRNWRCTAYELSERALSNCYAPKLLTACCVHSSVALLAG